VGTPYLAGGKPKFQPLIFQDFFRGEMDGPYLTG
jgi:hypothetical protein